MAVVTAALAPSLSSVSVDKPAESAPVVAEAVPERLSLPPQPALTIPIEKAVTEAAAAEVTAAAEALFEPSPHSTLPAKDADSCGSPAALLHDEAEAPQNAESADEVREEHNHEFKAMLLAAREEWDHMCENFQVEFLRKRTQVNVGRTL